MPDGESGAHLTGAADPTPELLSCIKCRNQKLKCDRRVPSCSRCMRVNVDCLYPESRRKPAQKRRNVKDLEDRLVQLEELLKNGTRNHANEDTAQQPHKSPDQTEIGHSDFVFEQPVVFGMNTNTAPFGEPMGAPSISEKGNDFSYSDHQLFATGMSEAPPPIDMVEELHNIYFSDQQRFIPIINQARYFHSFYSAPHLRPPMCLQYAVWAMAALGHAKYGMYYDIFYKRARQYVEEDETRGFGEHFITVCHAQTLCLIATMEARCLHLTKAAVSGAKCVKLSQILGLHCLDDPPDEPAMAATLLPPRDETEMEERRRVFWGAFCIDSHSSISTGWPSSIDPTQITTFLPCSEEAFREGRVEDKHTLDEVLKGAPSGTFAGAVIACHIFNRLLRHVHGHKPKDRPEDHECGPYWLRHYEIDMIISTLLIYLPEQMRLPQAANNPVAIHTNLNLHSAIIYLHNAACDKADRYNLPPHIKKSSQGRMATSAKEVVSIMKLTSHVSSGYRSPLVAFALYSALTAHTYQATQTTEPYDHADIVFLLKCMEAVGRCNIIAGSLLRQAVHDLHRNNVPVFIDAPWFRDIIEKANPLDQRAIPLLARSSITRHCAIQPPLPGRLPLGKPTGSIILPTRPLPCAGPLATIVGSAEGPLPVYGQETNKRKHLRTIEVIDDNPRATNWRNPSPLSPLASSTSQALENPLTCVPSRTMKLSHRLATVTPFTIASDEGSNRQEEPLTPSAAAAAATALSQQQQQQQQPMSQQEQLGGGDVDQLFADMMNTQDWGNADSADLFSHLMAAAAGDGVGLLADNDADPWERPDEAESR